MKKTVFFCSICLLFISLFFGTSAAATVYLSEITEITFPKFVLNADTPIIVWFYSGGAYTKFSQDVGKVARDSGMVPLVRMDKSLNSITANKYHVKRNNTFIFFVDGEPIARTSSIYSVDDYKQFVQHCIDEYERINSELEKQEWKPTHDPEKKH